MRKLVFLKVVLAPMVVLMGGQVAADEGMWLFDKLPVETLKSRYQFTPTREWTDHLMRASVRISYGGSGSFVSADGLVLTNHHVAADAIDALGKKDKKDYFEKGFFAKSLSEEKNPGNGLEVEALVSIQDVTAEILKDIKPGMKSDAAFAARRAAIAQLTREAEKKSGNKVEVVTLYQGAKFHLYEYKIYREVKLVFAPEKDIAFYGGDPHNFEFPRWNLDASLLRVYENGKPAVIKNYLRLPQRGLKAGDLVFVSGNPGTTERLLSVAGLEFVRDVRLPKIMETLWRLESLFGNFMQTSPDNKQKVEDTYFSIANSRKVRLDQLKGMQDPAVFSRLQAKEADLIQFAKKSGNTQVIKALESIKNAKIRHRDLYDKHVWLEDGRAFGSQLFGWARQIVRASVERNKEDGKRLEEYQTAKLKSLEYKLFSPHPVFKDVETETISSALSAFTAAYVQAGVEESIYNAILSGKGPRVRAQELVSGTQLDNAEYRKKLFGMSEEQLRKESDPLIQLAWAVDEPSREIRKMFESEVKEVERVAYDQLADLRFKMFGESVYPDATFSPRIAFGAVVGYKSKGVQIPAFTRYEGLYQVEKAQKGQPPFRLPQRWVTAKNKIDLNIPFNFVSTADIIGGNSGSPVVNREGELVGLIFDGNRESNLGSFFYDEAVNRSVAVDVRALVHALDRVYGSNHILKSMGVNRSSSKMKLFMASE